MNHKSLFVKIITKILVFLVFSTGWVSAQTSPTDFIHSNTINGELNAPSRMCITPDGNIYVADAYTKTIKKFNSTGNYLGLVDYDGVPLSIAISDNNCLFVGDVSKNKITRINSDGSKSIIYTGLIFPTDMVTGPDNQLYVVDGFSNKVIVMDFGGNIIRTIGTGVLLAPRCIAYDRQNQHIIVSEHGGVGTGFNLHAEIRIFGLTGNLISTFGGYGNVDGKFYRIQGLTVGKCGNIYVCDNYQGMISVFNSNGGFITRFGQFGTDNGKLNEPFDIDFDASQNLWISSMNNGALEVFTKNDILPTASVPDISLSVCEGESAQIPVKFTGNAPWTFTYSINGVNQNPITNTYNNPYIITTAIEGRYNVTSLSDAVTNGTCFSGTTLVTNNPKPTASLTTGNLSVCSGNSSSIPVNFTGTKPFNFTYTVNGANPKTIDNIYSNSYAIPASASGTYEITSLSGNGCIGTEFTGSTLVAINPSPAASINNFSSSICSGQSVVIPIYLTGTAPWSLTYTIDGQNPIIINSIADSAYLLNTNLSGYYEIAKISDANCLSGTFYGNANIQVKPLPGATIMSGNTNICLGQTTNIELSFTGSGPWNFSYSIDNQNDISITGIESNNFNLLVSQAGAFSLKSVSDANCNGNINSNNIDISTNPVYSFTDNYILCTGESFNWHNNDYSTPGTYYANYTSLSGCDSTYILKLTESSSTKILSIKLFLEGLYSGNGLMNQAQDISGSKFGQGIADKVNVELYENKSPYAFLYAFNDMDLYTDGTITINNIPACLSDSYFIAVHHRNSIETWSSLPVNFNNATMVFYDFSNSASQAFGNNLNLTNFAYSIFGGDPSQDGFVDGSDMAVVDNASSAILKGYNVEDINGDGIVDASDLAIIDNNSTILVHVNKP